MNKILIVSPGVSPVPAVKGGAIATLVETLIRVNEMYGDMDLVVTSPYNECAYIKSRNYSKTEFIFIRNNIITFLDKGIDWCLGRLSKYRIQPRHYLWKIFMIKKLRNILRTTKYEKIVFENSGYLLNTISPSDIRNKYEGKIYFHLHNDIPDNISLDLLNKCTVLSISNYLYKKIDRYTKGNFKGNFLRVQNGINCKEFSKELTKNERNSFRKKIGFQENDNIIIFVGRIDPAKGIEELVRALRRIDDVKLLVVGSSNFANKETSEFEIKMKDLFNEMKSKIIFTGYIPNEDLWKYYQISDIAVLPSIWEEPAGLTMLEAAASGIPLITTKVGGIPEYIGEDYALFLEKKDIENNICLGINEILKNRDKWNCKAKELQELVVDRYTEERFYISFKDALQGTATIE